ncbi:MAG TPA: asparaginase [Candidatus Peribacterales bacterium]|nr:asparaginase [Candidatus Peribacterales bacterium]
MLSSPESAAADEGRIEARPKLLRMTHHTICYHSSSMRPKVALLYVGGSIGMIMNQKTGRIDPVESLSEIHRFLPELQKEVALEFFPLANVGSSDVTPALWTEIAKTIEKLYDQFEGFVVVHGTNTMSYTAAALSFALQGLSKPVVLTGALLPLNDLAGDARQNLVYAIRAALLDIAEVCIVLGPRVLRGSRAKKVHESVHETFKSTRYPPLARFTRQFEMHSWHFVRRKRALSCKPTFDANVSLLTLHPGIPEGLLNAVLNARLHGIVMRAYGPGMIPEFLIPWIQKLTEMNIPIVMTSQVLNSHVDLQKYQRQLLLEKLGIISGKDMTYECALVKLMWALTQSQNIEKLQEIMEKNLVGELDE